MCRRCHPSAFPGLEVVDEIEIARMIEAARGEHGDVVDQGGMITAYRYVSLERASEILLEAKGVARIRIRDAWKDDTFDPAAEAMIKAIESLSHMSAEKYGAVDVLVSGSIPERFFPDKEIMIDGLQVGLCDRGRHYVSDDLLPFCPDYVAPWGLALLYQVWSGSAARGRAS